ncbi:SDR family oxidoreductase [Bradyrhizobium sp. WSM2254]|uniref:SDR family oxidoreductase n=1 Tax=Bradyrhizobium sp. WSM2254 TaxID=1188263 RepID=UPI00048912A9|nr:NAD(P)H-binding protein [Bradyrhizobium sp. WSM2254]
MFWDRKRAPNKVLIFGAAGHIGGPLARFLHREAPQTRLRLVTSNPANCEKLRREHPHAEIAMASYFDLPSLEKAVEGVEGVLVLTKSGTDEREAMTNLAVLLKKTNTAIQIVRLLSVQPEANRRRIPQSLRRHGLSPPSQHPIAKEILDESDLPVTYLNIGAAVMNDFYWMKEGLRREHKLVWPERHIPYIDPREIAEIAGRLFLSTEHRHIGQFYTLNNGQDLMGLGEVADLMSEVFQTKVTHDGSKESFFREYAKLGEVRLFHLWELFQYERENELAWSRNDFAERVLGRKPLTLRSWLEEHHDGLMRT